MVKAGESPSMDPSAGLAALEEDLPKVLRFLEAPTIEALGWSRPNKLNLLIPMTAERGRIVDNYTLRLAFHGYRRYPPGAQFVNPETLRYDYPLDQIHVPKLTSQECHTHVAYPRPGNPDEKIQLICCSATYEFYEVLHGVNDENHLWRENYTFYTTVVALMRAMASSYQGRFSANGQ
jgi:hypothetical protein